MDIEVINCNNIDYAKITLHEKKLNIKFAPNGTGKSSIAKALVINSEVDQNRLSELLPFKFRTENPGNVRPEVKGADSLKNILCFNEQYVSQFVFKPEELLSNSFDIFIRTETFKLREQEIEELIQTIKQLFIGNQELEYLIDTLKELGSAFKLSKSGLSKSSAGMKGLSSGNKIQHIPADLESYAPFIQSQSNVKWIDWQTNGYEYIDLSEKCPFCTAHTSDKKDHIKKIGLEYDKNIIKNLMALISVIEKLGVFFSDEAKEKLESITHLKDGIEREHETFLISVKTQIDTLIEKLEKLRTLSGFQFKDGDNVVTILPTYKIDLQFFSDLKSKRMIEAITPINNSINEVCDKANHLQGKINQQRSEMKSTIKRHQDNINSFLAYAGYRYVVEITGEGENSQLKLRHSDYKDHLKGGDQYLSFGEKNAFALVLFMYECLSKKPDLIILDDPISSFDKNKKYAILEMLFRRDATSCLKSKTVLMLTHDVEPIIDTVRSLSQKFKNQTSASFLKLEANSIIEYNIEKNDIQTYNQICKNILESDKNDVIKLIYLRRFFEISDSNGDAYQVISNLLHKRDRAIDTRKSSEGDDKNQEMDETSFINGCKEIEKYHQDFSYQNQLKQVTDVNDIKRLYHESKNGYEKLQIFRLLNLDCENSVIQKFVNETYHIENEFICQLDPTKFDLIPEYVVSECNRILLGIQ